MCRGMRVGGEGLSDPQGMEKRGEEKEITMNILLQSFW